MEPQGLPGKLYKRASSCRPCDRTPTPPSPRCPQHPAEPPSPAHLASCAGPHHSGFLSAASVFSTSRSLHCTSERCARSPSTTFCRQAGQGQGEQAGQSRQECGCERDRHAGSPGCCAHMSANQQASQLAYIPSALLQLECASAGWHAHHLPAAPAARTRSSRRPAPPQPTPAGPAHPAAAAPLGWAGTRPQPGQLPRRQRSLTAPPRALGGPWGQAEARGQGPGRQRAP